jgi:hypothetical protein
MEGGEFASVHITVARPRRGKLELVRTIAKIFHHLVRTRAFWGKLGSGRLYSHVLGIPHHPRTYLIFWRRFSRLVGSLLVPLDGFREGHRYFLMGLADLSGKLSGGRNRRLKARSNEEGGIEAHCCQKGGATCGRVKGIIIGKLR